MIDLSKPYNEQLDGSSRQHSVIELKNLHARKLRQKRLRTLVAVSLFSTCAFLLSTIYFGFQVYALNNLKTAKEVTRQAPPTTPAEIIDALSHHLLLPEGSPQIASLQDAKKLSDSQEFFREALNGDIVVVYDAMIIVYRPSRDIVVAVGDLESTTKGMVPLPKK